MKRTWKAIVAVVLVGILLGAPLFPTVSSAANEKKVVSPYGVFFVDELTGEPVANYIDYVEGEGEHIIYPDESKIPEAYELYPKEQSEIVSAQDVGRDGYLNGECTPGFVYFTVGEPRVTADLNVKFLYYQTKAVLAEYTLTLEVDKHTITADESMVPENGSVYPKGQSVDVIVYEDGSISKESIDFYIGVIDPSPNIPIPVILFFNVNVPDDAVVLSGDKYWMMLNYGDYFIDSEMDLLSIYDYDDGIANDPPVLENYRFVGWSTEKSGDPLYIDSYYIPYDNNGILSLYAVWEPVE